MSTLWVKFKRTILVQVVKDHLETFSTAIRDDEAKKDRRKAKILYYGVPLALGIPFFVMRVELQAVAQLISGITILTALLFALLVLMFNTGVTLKKEKELFDSPHDIKIVITDLRMNITYAALVAICVSILLVMAAVTNAPNSSGTVGGLAWGWTPPLATAFAHLSLTMLLILTRLRQAFNYIVR